MPFFSISNANSLHLSKYKIIAAVYFGINSMKVLSENLQICSWIFFSFLSLALDLFILQKTECFDIQQYAEKEQKLKQNTSSATFKTNRSDRIGLHTLGYLCLFPVCHLLIVCYLALCAVKFATKNTNSHNVTNTFAYGREYHGEKKMWRCEWVKPTQSQREHEQKQNETNHVTAKQLFSARLMLEWNVRLFVGNF